MLNSTLERTLGLLLLLCLRVCVSDSANLFPFLSLLFSSLSCLTIILRESIVYSFMITCLTFNTVLRLSHLYMLFFCCCFLPIVCLFVNNTSRKMNMRDRKPRGLFIEKKPLLRYSLITKGRLPCCMKAKRDCCFSSVRQEIVRLSIQNWND